MYPGAPTAPTDISTESPASIDVRFSSPYSTCVGTEVRLTELAGLVTTVPFTVAVAFTTTWATEAAAGAVTVAIPLEALGPPTLHPDPFTDHTYVDGSREGVPFPMTATASKVRGAPADTSTDEPGVRTTAESSSTHSSSTVESLTVEESPNPTGGALTGTGTVVPYGPEVMVQKEVAPTPREHDGPGTETTTEKFPTDPVRTVAFWATHDQESRWFPGSSSTDSLSQ